MRNLNLLFNIEYNLSDEKVNKIISPESGSSTNIVYMCSDTQIFSFDTKSGIFLSICKVENVIISAEYLALNDEICFALKSGEVMSYDLFNKCLKEITYCEGGIESMSCSPTQEIIVFATKINTIVVMTSLFEPIIEINLNDSISFGDGQFVNIGWGSKETQFHGSEGHKAASLSADLSVDVQTNAVDDIIISWRGDGELFAASFIENKKRIFKVFNKEGILQYTSEKLNDLGESLSWRPSGTWIAIPNRYPNKYTIGLFEKNGLRHREIILPFKAEEQMITKLAWSNDSDILAIETTHINIKQTNIYLFTISNYHWYLKQHLKFNEDIVDMVWDLGLGEEKTLHIILGNNKYFVFRWHLSITISSGYIQENQSVVAVIDGMNLLLTDFRNKVIPPPISSFKIENSSYINACGFLQTSKEEQTLNNQLFILDSNNTLSFYKIEFEKSGNINILKHIKLIQKHKIEHENSFVSHCLWSNNENFIYCRNIKENTEVNLFQLFDNEIKSTIIVPGNVGSIMFVDSYKFLINLKNSKTYNIKIMDNQLINEGIYSENSICCEKNEAFVLNGIIKVISLTSTSNLTINGSNISSDVTSFFLNKNYLVFTQLHCIKFYHIIDEKIIDERRIESGGKLIAIIPNDSKTILQMPRGNLEALHPRVLSLEIIGDYLDKLQYGKAMDLLRKQRINLNILFDHNPKMFMDNLDIFIDQITNPQWLNLFISDLQNEDFTLSMYSCNYSNSLRNFPENFLIENKINFICTSLCKRMEEINEGNLLPIITTHVKMGNMEKALLIIWSQKQKDLNQNNNYDEKKSKSEEAMQYILYLVDVNELFNVALGLYDFGLVLFVASKSQKDPKEYISFLNNIKQYEENYRKFKIDVHLKRYEKALEHLSTYDVNTEQFAEAFELIQKHKLYRKSLNVFENMPECYKKVSLAFANHLRAAGKHENASIMYERANDISQSIMSAKHILDWRRCLMLTGILHPNNEKELEKMSLSMVSALEENGKHEEASNLLITYAKDLNQGLLCMLRGRLYLKALCEARMNKPDFVENYLRPHLILYSEELKCDIESNEETFRKYKLRLLYIRKLKLEKNNELVFNDGIDECDLLSDTTSINSSNYTTSSKGTGKTFRSSKNRRKHERKLMNLKEGNPFEDIALIDTLYNLVIKINYQQQNIHDVCKALIEIRTDPIARTIQKIYCDLLKFIKISLDEIWLPEMQISTLPATDCDYVQYQNQQTYVMLSIEKRFKPQLNIIDWEHEILK